MNVMFSSHTPSANLFWKLGSWEVGKRESGEGVFGGEGGNVRRKRVRVTKGSENGVLGFGLSFRLLTCIWPVCSWAARGEDLPSLVV